MLHLGDITKINGAQAPVVDCVIGGSPCQDLSVAGKRAGLAGERSGLYMEQIRIVKEMRQADVDRGKSDVDVRPRYMVWENVPGAFSSNGGKDFAAVLEEAIRVAEPEAPNVPVPEKGWPTSGCFWDELGRWSVAWRVLDAQFWGVPQRRRRIALVADFGGLSAPEILFVRKSVSGDIEPGKPKGKETAGDAGEGTGGAGVIGFTNRGFQSGSVSETLRECSHGAIPMAIHQDPIYTIDRETFNCGQNFDRNLGISNDGTVPTLKAVGPGGVFVKHIVRRLTPLECERLQGFPDGWTDIGEWVLKRMCACYERDATMASLFDGIGGFPLIWEQLNGKESCLWASEIDEFPMAVTKVRFESDNY